MCFTDHPDAEPIVNVKDFSWLIAVVIVHVLGLAETLSTFVATIYLYKGM